jgi:hypothetical protein
VSRLILILDSIPRLFVRLSALSERFLALSESGSQHVQLYRVGVQDLTAKVKAQQRALTGMLFTLDRLVCLYGRHILLPTTYFGILSHRTVFLKGVSPP